MNTRRPRTRTCAATLVDVMITVLIMGILAAVAAPRFTQTLARLRVEAAARRIAADLNYARRTAMLNSTQCVVAFTLSPPGYAMTNVDDPKQAGAPYAVALANVDAGVTLSLVSLNGESSLAFNSYGRPLAGGSLQGLTAGEVRVAMSGQTRQVTINTSSGEAEVL